ncbi:hypothetical protein HOLleu_18236 [Holothuria leucospilota]|uniref:Uncharacterized protein n=1 Tax=Holothuria leucospilota TaxID=206669 RepID=A0A9Q1H9P6_HOLLE|nr:hypothetical protein HOLleu_18236 [Holothuria leucospilota]
MAGINRTNSPMNLYRDDYLDTKEQLDKAREAIIDEQNQKPAFLVGSIERVNERIANLDKELQMFASSLVIESQESNVEEDYFFPSAEDRNGPVKGTVIRKDTVTRGILISSLSVCL